MFRPYIIGKQFIVRTDHSSLEWLMRQQGNGRLARWALSLQEFDIKVIPRPGKLNGNADIISRLSLEVDEKEEERKEKQQYDRYFAMRITTLESSERRPKKTDLCYNSSRRETKKRKEKY